MINVDRQLIDDYQVILAKNGVQGIDKATRYVPDLILLDLFMPDMDGFDVVKELKDSMVTEDIPIIILTGASADDKEELGLNLGASDYVYKPFNPAVLKARIRTQLHIKSQKRSLNLLTQKLIPLLIGILIAFGISKISQKNQATCPSPDQLKDDIDAYYLGVLERHPSIEKYADLAGIAEYIAVLKQENTLALNDLKAKAGLSNKGWDKGIKGLAKHGLTKVTKTEDALIVELLD